MYIKTDGQTEGWFLHNRKLLFAFNKFIAYGDPLHALCMCKISANKDDCCNVSFNSAELTNLNRTREGNPFICVVTNCVVKMVECWLVHFVFYLILTMRKHLEFSHWKRKNGWGQNFIKLSWKNTAFILVTKRKLFTLSKLGNPNRAS